MGGIFTRLHYYQESKGFQLLENATVERVLPTFYFVFPLSLTPRPIFTKVKETIKTQRPLGMPSGGS